VIAALSVRLRALLANMIRVLLSQLGNQFLAGSAAVFIGQGLTTMVRHGLKVLHKTIMDALYTTVRLGEEETSEAIAWARTQDLNAARLELACKPPVTCSDPVARDYDFKPGLKSAVRLPFPSAGAAGKGWLVQWWHSRNVWITIGEEEHMPARASTSAKTPHAKAQIAFFGRSTEVVQRLLDEGRYIKRERKKKYVEVITTYNFDSKNYKGLGWLYPREGQERKQPGRSINSVILPRDLHGRDLGQAILEDAAEFLASELWYSERGIPYRRGYLLHGKPGAGKSSLVMALASELELSIYVVQLSSENLTDESLLKLMQTMKEQRCILLFEDVDAATDIVQKRKGQGSSAPPSSSHMGEASSPHPGSPPRKLSQDVSPNNGTETREMMSLMIQQQQQLQDLNSKKDGDKQTVSLSGLLNILDGPTATNGRLLFMTTNHKERLDPALIRSGRIDYEIEFTMATEEQIQRQFIRFYTNFGKGEEEPEAAVEHRKELASRFARELEQQAPAKFTSADIQGYLMKYRKNPEQAVANMVSHLLAEREQH